MIIPPAGATGVGHVQSIMPPFTASSSCRRVPILGAGRATSSDGARRAVRDSICTWTSLGEALVTVNCQASVHAPSRETRPALHKFLGYASAS